MQKYNQVSANNTFGDILGAVVNPDRQGLGVKFRHEVPFESAFSLAASLFLALVAWSIVKKYLLD